MAVTAREEVGAARGERRAPRHSSTPASDRPAGARRPWSVDRAAARVGLIYLALALLWVVFSDRVAGLIVTDHSLLTRVQTLKGSAFVTGSALLIFLLMRRELGDRERDQVRLRQAETRYRTLVEQIPAITYVNATDEAARTLYISPQAETLLGFGAREWRQDPDFWFKRLHPEDRERAHEGWLACRRGAPVSLEYRMIARDGRVLWFRDEAHVLEGGDGRPGLIHGLMLDITERKRAEEDLQRSEEQLRGSLANLRRTDEERRRLLGRLVGAEERERRRIASEVHDGPVQKLAAVGLRLGMLRARLTDAEDREALEELLQTVERSTSSLRSLLFELRPPAIERDGLAAALREYLDHVGFEAGLDCRIENNLETEPSPEVGTIAYRIAREALTNAAKHAGARRVSVVLAPCGGGLKVRIEDDGVGFDPEGAEGSSPEHLGLSDMRERAEGAGGWFRVDSAPGEGTAVEFWVPAPNTGGVPVGGAPTRQHNLAARPLDQAMGDAASLPTTTMTRPRQGTFE